MPQMYSMDATFLAVKDLIYALQNPAPALPLVTVGNGHKETLRTLVELFIKANPQSVPPRVTGREVVQK